MKKINLMLALLLLTVSISLAQMPEQFKYQAVLRDASGNIIVNQSKAVIINIIQGSVIGSSVFTETHNVTTTAQGLILLNIGSINSLSSVDWSSSAYFIKITVDGVEMGTSQLLSVPYALHAKTVKNENDPIFSNSPAFGISSTNLVNWNTAFGWGNHSTAGYLTSFSEIDPIFGNSPAHNVTSTNLANWNTAFGWGNHATAGYLSNFTETDPIFGNSPAHGITTTNTANWNTAFGWGNHAGLYLPISYVPTWNELLNKPTTLEGYGITDAMSVSHPANTITSSNITNWNTAFSWGNHAGLYRPIGYVPSWSDILNKPNFSIVATSGNYNDLSNVLTAGSGININSSNQIINTAPNQVVSLFGSSSINVSGTYPNFTINTNGVSGNFTVLTNVDFGASKVKQRTVTVTNGVVTNLGTETDWISTNTNTVTDFDGNVYQTIQIGAQTWMTENLKSTHYADGTPINGANAYNNDEVYVPTYGRLYVWDVAMKFQTVEMAQGVCPTGWHIPSDAEWQVLVESYGGISLAGGALKETGTAHWQTPNTGATNASGFTALGGGFKMNDGSYGSLKYSGCFWSSSQVSGTSAWSRVVTYMNTNAQHNNYNEKAMGMSIRCIKNSTK